MAIQPLADRIVVKVLEARTTSILSSQGLNIQRSHPNQILMTDF